MNHLRRSLRAALVLAAATAFLLPARPPAGLAQGGGTWRSHACLDCVRDVAVTADAVWVATMSGGVIRQDRRGGPARHYTTADGLAGNGGGKLVVGPDGDLWMGIPLSPLFAPRVGISHFDGRRWTAHTKATGLPSDQVGSIAAGPGGSAWVTTELGPAHFDGRAWKLHGAAEGLPPGLTCTAVALGQGSDVWVSTDRGLARFDGAAWSLLPFDPAIPPIAIRSMAVDNDGVVWVGSDADLGVFSYHPRGLPDGSYWKAHPYNGPAAVDPLLQGSQAMRIKADPAGGVWVGDLLRDSSPQARAQLARWDGQRWTVTEHPTPHWPSTVDFSFDGQLWIGHVNAGLAHWDGAAWDRLPSGGGPSNLIAFAITTDPGGHVWTGFMPLLDKDNLVNRFDGQGWTRFSSAEGMLQGEVLGIAQQAIDADARGTVWVGVGQVGIAWYDGRAWASKTFSDLNLPQAGIGAVVGDDRGGVWVATRAGALHYDGRSWRNYTRADGLASDDVRAVAIDRRGGRERLWFGTDQGLSLWDRGRWTHYSKADGLGTNNIGAIAVDERGDAVWIASRSGAGGGLTRYDGRSWRVFTKADGLPADSYWAIEPAPDGDLWVVGQDDGQPPGLTRFDGTRWTTYTIADGLMNDTVFDVAIDSRGTVWAATIAGISEFRPDAAPAPSPKPPSDPCVCQVTRRAVPPAVIADAVANPGSIAGWRQPLDPNKPEGPLNPPRECLGLQRATVPFHPMFNPLIWRVGCR